MTERDYELGYDNGYRNGYRRGRIEAAAELHAVAQLKETLLVLMALARRAQTIEAHGHFSHAADEIRALIDQGEKRAKTAEPVAVTE